MGCVVFCKSWYVKYKSEILKEVNGKNREKPIEWKWLIESIIKEEDDMNFH